MRNHRRLLEDCFGADRAEVRCTTIRTRLQADEIAHIVRDCGATGLVVSAEFDPLAAAWPAALAASRLRVHRSARPMSAVGQMADVQPRDQDARWWPSGP